MVWLCLLLSIICGNTECVAQPQTSRAGGVSADDASPKSADAGLPMNFERRTGDLDEMVRRQTIRALVLYSRAGFFYVDGRPEGIYYEALQAFEQFAQSEAATQGSTCRLRLFRFVPIRSKRL